MSSQLKILQMIRDDLCELRNKIMDSFWSWTPTNRRLLSIIDSQLDVIEVLIDSELGLGDK